MGNSVSDTQRPLVSNRGWTRAFNAHALFKAWRSLHVVCRRLKAHRLFAAASLNLSSWTETGRRLGSPPGHRQPTETRMCHRVCSWQHKNTHFRSSKWWTLLHLMSFSELLQSDYSLQNCWNQIRGGWCVVREPKRLRQLIFRHQNQSEEFDGVPPQIIFENIRIQMSSQLFTVEY